jgi:hypothetical protein
VKRTVIFYGALGGALIATLKVVEYRFLVLEHSLEIYGGIVALLFSLLGIWLGLKLTRTRETVVVREVPVRVEVEVRVPVAGRFVWNETRLEQLGITPRELAGERRAVSPNHTSISSAPFKIFDDGFRRWSGPRSGRHLPRTRPIRHLGNQDRARAAPDRRRISLPKETRRRRQRVNPKTNLIVGHPGHIVDVHR